MIKHPYIKISSGLLCVVIYVITCLFYAENATFKGDTLEYLINFNDIKSVTFPYGIEFVSSGLMWLVNFFGGSFRIFLFVTLLTWLPIVFLLGYLTVNSFFCFFVFLFFLSPYFIENAIFLIRQYSAALFFLLFIIFKFRGGGWKGRFILFSLAIFSHLSSVFWFMLLSKRVSSFVYSNLGRVVGLSLCVISFVFGGVVYYFVEFISYFSLFLNFDVVSRKLAFYSSGEFNDVKQVSVSALVLAFSILFMYGFPRFNCYGQIAKSLFSFFVIQAFIVIVLRDNLVIANRFGFFGYYFSLPIILSWIVLLSSGNKISARKK